MTKDDAGNQMWGGRFASGPDAILEAINASIDYDQKFYAQDIAGSKAHANMLRDQGIISAEDAKQICDGLDTILSEIENGTFEFSRALEDIHMNVEARLATLIGPAHADFKQPVTDLQAAGALKVVTRETLAPTLAHLIESKKDREAMSVAANQVATTNRGTTERHIKKLRPLLNFNN